MNEGTPLGVTVQYAGTAAVLNGPTAELYPLLFYIVDRDDRVSKWREECNDFA
jgi:hypothetical protein